jgi:predicted nucleotidyltransferase
MQLRNIQLSDAVIEQFCRKWNLRELSVFCSVLREDFQPTSDIDVLVVLASGIGMTLETDMAMRGELSKLFGGREIDLVQKRLVQNPFFRHRILTTRRVLYAA